MSLYLDFESSIARDNLDGTISTLDGRTLPKPEHDANSPVYGYGFKFLTPFLTTESGEFGSFPYNAPRCDQSWSDFTIHPTPAEPHSDPIDCGPGRLHVMRRLSANLAPRNWWVWFVRYAIDDVVGSSDEKCGVIKFQLRRIAPAGFHQMIKAGWLSGADLSRANLYGANLSRADLSGASLSGADLSGASLSRADLSGASLSRADLFGADLSRADLSGANLFGASLYGASLYGADLPGANLYGANLSGADLSGANLSGADLSGANLSGALNKSEAIGLTD